MVVQENILRSSLAVEALLHCGSTKRVQRDVCSPLGVVEQSQNKQKKKNTADCRFANVKYIYIYIFLRKPNFKYYDFWAADTIFGKEDYFFSFDLKSAYQHIVIDPKILQLFWFLVEK